MRANDLNGGLDQIHLMRLFHYDPTTGVFTRLVRMGARGVVGARADFTHKASGRSIVKVNGRRYYASRLAWLYMVGSWPSEMVDHINMDVSDTRWENLREADRGQNNANRRASGKSGIKGAYIQDNGRFASAIRVGGKTRHLGTFDTAEEASAAYFHAATEEFGAFARIA